MLENHFLGILLRHPHFASQISLRMEPNFIKCHYLSLSLMCKTATPVSIIPVKFDVISKSGKSGSTCDDRRVFVRCSSHYRSAPLFHTGRPHHYFSTSPHRLFHTNQQMQLTESKSHNLSNLKLQHCNSTYFTGSTILACRSVPTSLRRNGTASLGEKSLPMYL